MCESKKMKMALGNRKTRPNLISRLLCLMLLTWTAAKTVYNWTHVEKETQNIVLYLDPQKLNFVTTERVPAGIMPILCEIF